MIALSATGQVPLVLVLLDDNAMGFGIGSGIGMSTDVCIAFYSSESFSSVAGIKVSADTIGSKLIGKLSLW